jgi:hypothetical protein
MKDHKKGRCNLGEVTHVGMGREMDLLVASVVLRVVDTEVIDWTWELVEISTLRDVVLA